MAERIMQARLAQRYGQRAESILISSAGLKARPSAPIIPQAIEQLKRRGIEADGFTATPLDPEGVARAHLVLTATRRQRDVVIAMVPSALRHTFTWRELAWLLQGLRPGEIPGAHLIHRVANVASVAGDRRGYRRPPPPEEFDIEDPTGGPASGYRRAAADIDSAMTQVVAVL
jgi:protein-tyrosine phosphatase